jgi:hypothetical protein
MCVYLGPGYPDRSFCTELDDVEINTRIRGILVYGADLNSGPNPIPLREGIIIPWVSLLKLVFVWWCHFPFFLMHTRYCEGSRVCAQCPWGVTLHEDVARREANRADCNTPATRAWWSLLLAAP